MSDSMLRGKDGEIPFHQGAKPLLARLMIEQSIDEVLCSASLFGPLPAGWRYETDAEFAERLQRMPPGSGRKVG